MPEIEPDRRPSVSIVTAARDAAPYLERSIASALAQRDVSVEVLVVDDASGDETPTIARRARDRDGRCRVLRNATPRGPGGARNRAIDAARGEWVAVLDADDVMAPRRLSRMIALAEREQADIVLGNLAEVDKCGRPAGPAAFIEAPRAPVEWSAKAYVAGNARERGARTYGYLKPLLRRSFLDRCAIRYDETLMNGEDCHLILAAYAAGARVWFSPEPDYFYTRHDASLSHRAAPRHLSALLCAEDRFAASLPEGSDLLPMMRRRRRGLADLLTTEICLTAARRARLDLAAWSLIRRPRAAPMALGHLAEAAARRLRRLIEGSRNGASQETGLGRR